MADDRKPRAGTLSDDRVTPSERPRRAPSIMSDEERTLIGYDKRLRTPARGVPIVAPPPRVLAPDEWCGDTGTVDTPLVAVAQEPDGVPELRMRLRVKDTHSGMIRLDGRVDKLEQGLAGVNDKVDTLTGHVIKAIETIGPVAAHVGEIVKERDAHRERETVTVTTEVEIDKTDRITRIKDAADARKKRRAFWFKAGGVALGMLGLAGTALVTHLLEQCR